MGTLTLDRRPLRGVMIRICLSASASSETLTIIHLITCTAAPSGSYDPNMPVRECLFGDFNLGPQTPSGSYETNMPVCERLFGDLIIKFFIIDHLGWSTS